MEGMGAQNEGESTSGSAEVRGSGLKICMSSKRDWGILNTEKK
jgi:hypothetical protein